MNDYPCRICWNRIMSTPDKLCDECSVNLDTTILVAANQIKVAKTSDYFIDMFKRMYTAREVSASLWRLEAAKELFITKDLKWGVR